MPARKSTETKHATVDKVNFVERHGDYVNISFVDTKGESVKVKIEKKSAGWKHIQPLLKEERLIESIPKYPQSFSYKKEPFIGLKFSGKDIYESPSSESEIKQTSLGKAGYHTRFTIRNPRVVGSDIKIE
jgi:prepilin-type processing-associated H-X9-DG protein